MRIVDFSICSAYPPLSGGGQRIFHINLELSARCYIFHFAFVPSEYVFLAKTKLVRYMLLMGTGKCPKIPLKSTMRRINERYIQYTFGNLIFLLLSRVTYSRKLPEFVPSLLDCSSVGMARHEIVKSDLVQVETPWPFDWVSRNTPKSKPIVLVQHDAVHRMYEKVCPRSVSRMIREKEKRAVERADAIVVVSRDDEDSLCRDYGVEKSKIHIVPHGINALRFTPSEQEKAETKSRFGFSDRIIVLFTGSSHFPSVNAVEAIHNIAAKVKDEKIVFLVAGSVGERVHRRRMHNVHYTGYVEDIEPYLRMADIAINPVLSGGGTNTKMMEYLANGLPVITTGFGSRGLCLEDHKHVIISDINGFADEIRNLIANKEERQRLSEEGRRLVESCHDWKAIGRKALDLYESLLR